MLNNTEYKQLSAELSNEPRVKWFNIDDNEQRVFLDVYNATNSFSFDFYKGVKFLAKPGEAVARVIDGLVQSK